ncbi:uncharacterized protein LOC141802438 [Halichoeres trimaculatus]|uniref:uncharacterized protein LOC141802438 n=1 Tax=Halichoeres trimaculatus TaxID=147232 RepID=UPI003D9F020B
MSRFQDEEDLFERRLLTEVSRDMGQRTPSGYEEELQRQRELLDVVIVPEIELQGADVQLVIVKKEELPPEQQERSPYPDQEDNEFPLIKEEQEELWIGQSREQLQELEEADTKFLFPSVHMKSEKNDEEEPESSLLHQRLTDYMETAAGGEDCGRPEPERSSDPERNFQPEIEVKIEAWSDTGSETEASSDTGPGTEEVADEDEAETVQSHNISEHHQTNHAFAETRPFKCSECGKGFDQNKYLNRHMLVHTQERPFSCPKCEKGFKFKGHLKTHMLVHSKERPLSCSECGKGFRQRGNLATHMLVHTKKNRYSCSECGKGFKHKVNLTGHMFVHMKEKPYSCSECGKGFTLKGNMTKHMAVHSKGNSFSCSECGRTFNYSSNLKKHMFVHAKEKPYSCSEYGKELTLEVKSN